MLKCKESFEETWGEALELIGGFGELGSPLILKPNRRARIQVLAEETERQGAPL